MGWFPGFFSNNSYLFVFSEEEISRRGLKRKHSNDTEVTENLQQMASTTGTYNPHSQIYVQLLPGSEDTTLYVGLSREKVTEKCSVTLQDRNY